MDGLKAEFEQQLKQMGGFLQVSDLTFTLHDNGDGRILAVQKRNRSGRTL